MTNPEEIRDCRAEGHRFSEGSRMSPMCIFCSGAITQVTFKWWLQAFADLLDKLSC